MKKALIALVLLLSGCSATNPDYEQVLQRHEAVVNALTRYLIELQLQEIIPTAPELNQAKEKAAQ